jgi:hypothetical protein
MTSIKLYSKFSSYLKEKALKFLFTEITAVYSENHARQINALYV